MPTRRARAPWDDDIPTEPLQPPPQARARPTYAQRATTTEQTTHSGRRVVLVRWFEHGRRRARYWPHRGQHPERITAEAAILAAFPDADDITERATGRDAPERRWTVTRPQQ